MHVRRIKFIQYTIEFECKPVLRSKLDLFLLESLALSQQILHQTYSICIYYTVIPIGENVKLIDSRKDKLFDISIYCLFARIILQFKQSTELSTSLGKTFLLGVLFSMETLISN